MLQVTDPKNIDRTSTGEFPRISGNARVAELRSRVESTNGARLRHAGDLANDKGHGARCAELKGGGRSLEQGCEGVAQSAELRRRGGHTPWPRWVWDPALDIRAWHRRACRVPPDRKA